MALWKGRGGNLNKDLEFRSWHCGRQGGGGFNKELDLRSLHCGRQRGFKVTFITFGLYLIQVDITIKHHQKAQ